MSLGLPQPSSWVLTESLGVGYIYVLYAHSLLKGHTFTRVRDMQITCLEFPPRMLCSVSCVSPDP